MSLEHTRHQWPVGQGFFHTGSVSLGGETLHYAYDCGAERSNQESLDSCVDRYIETLDGASINMLFLSHLHWDHVAGLERLLVRCGVETVILPYMSPTGRLLLVAEALEQGTLTGNQLSLLCNPTRWFVNRGVRTVVYVRAEEPPNDAPPNWTGFDPDTPLLRPEDEKRQLQPTGNLRLDLDAIRRSSIGELAGRNNVIVISCLIPLRLTGSTTPFLPNWQFVTFVHPEGEREKAFREAVARAFGRTVASDKTFEIDQSAMLRILQSAEDRDKLASCYMLVRRNLNLTSLSVYSGPINMTNLRAQLRHPASGYVGQRAAWLGTGDSNLAGQRRREAFLRHYQSLRELIFHFSLPHHGSRHNFHAELLSFGQVFSVAVGTNNKFGHPHPEVVSQLARRYFHKTTEFPATAFFERLTIESGASV